MDKYLARELNQIAKVDFDRHEEECNYNDPFNCRACGLQIGYKDGPIADKWAAVYVAAEEPIKEEWRNAFIDELTHTDEEYRHTLENLTRYFGVCWK